PERLAEADQTLGGTAGGTIAGVAVDRDVLESQPRPMLPLGRKIDGGKRRRDGEAAQERQDGFHTTSLLPRRALCRRCCRIRALFGRRTHAEIAFHCTHGLAVAGARRLPAEV